MQRYSPSTRCSESDTPSTDVPHRSHFVLSPICAAPCPRCSGCSKCRAYAAGVCPLDRITSVRAISHDQGKHLLSHQCCQREITCAFAKRYAKVQTSQTRNKHGQGEHHAKEPISPACTTPVPAVRLHCACASDRCSRHCRTNGPERPAHQRRPVDGARCLTTARTPKVESCAKPTISIWHSSSMPSVHKSRNTRLTPTATPEFSMSWLPLRENSRLAQVSIARHF